MIASAENQIELDGGALPLIPLKTPLVRAWVKTKKVHQEQNSHLPKQEKFPSVLLPKELSGYIKCKKHDFF